MQYPNKVYHIIENQVLDISLLNNKNNYKDNFTYIQNEYIEFLKNCYKINNTIFPYDIFGNKFPKGLFAFISLQDYIYKNGHIYLQDSKCRKVNALTGSKHQPYLEDEYNDNRYAITILYFHNVPEEIGKMEILIPTYIKRTKKWKQNLIGNKVVYIKHIVKSGTVVIINSYTTYKFTVEKKLKNEYYLPIIEFNGSIEYPLQYP